MNINPTNCGQARQTAFKGINEENYEQFVERTEELSDTFTKTKKNGKKSRLGILASIAMAGAVTFIGGKLLGDKLSRVFPKASEKISAHIEKFSNNKLFKAGEKVVEKLKGKPGEYAKKIYNGFTNLFKGKGNVANVAGILGVATLGKEIVTVDKNGDGIKDIAQKHVNAYKNASEKLGVVGDVAHMLS